MSIFQEDNGKWYYRTEVFENIIYGPCDTKEQAQTAYDEMMHKIHKYASKIIEEKTARLKSNNDVEKYFENT